MQYCQNIQNILGAYNPIKSENAMWTIEATRQRLASLVTLNLSWHVLGRIFRSKMLHVGRPVWNPTKFKQKGVWCFWMFLMHKIPNRYSRYSRHVESNMCGRSTTGEHQWRRWVFWRIRPWKWQFPTPEWGQVARENTQLCGDKQHTPQGKWLYFCSVGNSQYQIWFWFTSITHC